MRKKQLKSVVISEESFRYNGNFLNEKTGKLHCYIYIYIYVIRIMKHREIIILS